MGSIVISVKCRLSWNLSSPPFFLLSEVGFQRCAETPRRRSKSAQRQAVSSSPWSTFLSEVRSPSPCAQPIHETFDLKIRPRILNIHTTPGGVHNRGGVSERDGRGYGCQVVCKVRAGRRLGRAVRVCPGPSIPVSLNSVPVLFKDTGRGRTRTGRHTLLQNADRGRARSNTTHTPAQTPTPARTAARTHPDRTRNKTVGTTWPRNNPGTRQTAGRATSNPHLDPRAPLPGQLSQKDRDPCRQRDLRPHRIYS